MATAKTSGSGFGFGLRLEASFDAPGIAPAQADLGQGRSSVLRLVSDSSLRQAVAGPGLTVLAHAVWGGARFFIWSHPEAGILVQHDYFGRFRVAGGGTQVDCAPREMANWMWQRFLVGQLLPIAALLQGLEPMHASVVAVGGEAVVLVGTSGSGKTSVALHMLQTGGAFIADDVAAIELAEGRAYVHPGAALSNVDSLELDRLDPDLTRSWRRMGAVEGEERVLLNDVQRAPLPISHIFVLTRNDQAREITIESDGSGWATALLGAHFNPYVRDSARSARWLEVCASLGDTAGLHRLTAPTRDSARPVAEAVLEKVNVTNS